MSDTEPTPLRGWERVVSQASIVLAVLAGTIFITIIVLGSGGSDRLSAVYGPIGIGATVLGLVTAIISVSRTRTRVLGITSLVVLVPCVVLALLTIVALGSR